ncbi:MAG: family 16 glycosylhydrolase [Oscillospiraceae bacterium]|nr:family 16 glycosylhydrolase [Oscillospiraceae bacterium]
MKKYSQRLVAAVAALTITGSAVFTAFAAGLGDYDGDGKVGLSDVKLMQSYLLGKSGPGVTDFNNDGRINAVDLSALKRSVLNPSVSGTIPDYGTQPDTTADMYSNFRSGDAGDFFASDGWTNGKPFDCFWYKQNAEIVKDHLELRVDQKWNAGDGNPDWNPSYSGGEFRTNEFYGYGYYETSMQAIKNDGVVSSFFTYTGPSDNNPWDEIDIEILGKDTTKVQLNYYTNGVGNHEKMIDLGFDASEGYHTYGFDWQRDKITWYVDGKEVYSATQNIPSTPGKIMMNAWPGKTVDDWLKAFNGQTPLTARYQWVTYKKSSNAQQQNPPQQDPNTIPDYGTQPDTTADMYSNFRSGDAGDFFASDGWTNGKPFDCFWYKQNAEIVKDHLELRVDQKWNAGDGNPDWNPSYSGGEFRTNEFYGYGYYETSMQAIKNDGVVSSFFTYTGPSDNNPWDEIDIEILGKDTTKVQLNYYTNGVGNHEKMIDLGFDASEGYHTYGFDWQRDKITWYVDGKEVYSATQNIPSTPGKIMMNAWPGKTVDDWLKAFNGKTPLTARYQWVTYKKSSNTQSQPQNPTTGNMTPSGLKDMGTPMNSSATMVSDFRTGNAGDFFASDGWTNGKPFDCFWYKQNAQIVSTGNLELRVDRKWNAGDGNPDWNPGYSGGEFRTNDFYSFGYYETSMQAIKNDGVVSSFFTYTGPSDNNPWDEIDIEILGKDTTKVQLNYYTNGVGNHEKMIDLGFDASEGYHTYGFDWQRDKITWYVDGKAVYTAYQNIPTTPGKIMMNAWPGKTVDDWLKAFNGKTPLTARYQWVTYNKQ